MSDPVVPVTDQVERLFSAELDERTREFYRNRGYGEVPDLSIGDDVNPWGLRGICSVIGFRAHGMLVEVVRKSDGQEFCVPRYGAVGGWVTRD